ncbi:hypothetical protein ACSNOJ_15495 [Streptomyces sp. URMC 128]
MESNVRQSTRKYGKPNEWWAVILELASLIIAVASLVAQLLR